ncbi:MAG TPA: hypothetical protein VMV24_00915 [Candidatus Dormibacteraeota bacterium]|nr:hypothetical protein [Candidatus Dormibacteraeota bacterium]
MRILGFEGVPTASIVDEFGGHHIIPATEYREPDFSSYDRLIRSLGDETLGSMGVSATYDVENLPTRAPLKNLGIASHGSGHIPKLVK